MTVTPLAAESLGVRSLAAYIQTSDTTILIDPGVALGFRDGYHPHPREYQLLADFREKIHRYSSATDVIVVSHYHHDHFQPFYQNYAYFWSTPEEASLLYNGRRVWCKDIRSNINYSQQSRGYHFVRKVRKIAQSVEYADGRAMKFNQTLIRFSPPVPHGEKNTKLGWVIMTAIRCGDFCMVHASDTQGPMEKLTTDWILRQKPDVVMIAGPPTYLAPDRVGSAVIVAAAENLKTLAVEIPMVIVDHHLLRDSNWSDWLDPIRQHARDHGNQLMTVAEVLGVEENLLEVKRESLYRQTPVTPAFEDWVRQVQGNRIQTPPPLP